MTDTQRKEIVRLRSQGTPLDETANTKSYQNDNKPTTCYYGDSERISTVELKGITGCRVTLEFADKPNPQVRIRIANMLIDSFLNRRCSK